MEVDANGDQFLPLSPATEARLVEEGLVSIRAQLFPWQSQQDLSTASNADTASTTTALPVHVPVVKQRPHAALCPKPAALELNTLNAGVGPASGAQAALRRPWATGADWNSHRALITRLYRDEDRTLTDVMEIMERRHGFYATYGYLYPRL